MVEIMRDEGGALDQAEHVPWQLALEAPSVNPSRVLNVPEEEQVPISSNIHMHNDTRRPCSQDARTR